MGASGILALGLLSALAAAPPREPAAQQSEAAPRAEARADWRAICRYLEAAREPSAASLAELEAAARDLWVELEAAPEVDAELVCRAAAGLRAGFLARAADFADPALEPAQPGIEWTIFFAAARKTAQADYALARRLLGELEGELARSGSPRARAHPSLAWALIELADAERLLQDFARSREHLERARELLAGPGVDPLGAAPRAEGAAAARFLAYWFDTSGQYHYELGRLEEAARDFEEFRRRALELESESMTWDALANLVRVDLAAGAPSLALAHVERLLGDPAAYRERFGGDPAAAFAARHELRVARAQAAAMLARAGEAPPFDPECELEALCAEAPQGSPARAAAEQELVALAFDRGDLAVARERIARAPELEAGAQDSLAWMQRAQALRSARLSGSATELAASLGDARAALPLLLALWSERDATQSGLSQTHPRGAFLRELCQAECAVHPGERGVWNALALLARTQAIGALTRELAEKAALPELDAGALPALLAEGLTGPARGVLAYVHGRHESLAFALGGGGPPECFALAPFESLDRLAGELESALLKALEEAGGAPERLAAAAARASEGFLPAPLRGRVASWRELTVVGAQNFAGLPWECLSARDGEPLGRTHALALAPSLSAGIALARQSASAGTGPGTGAWLLASPAARSFAGERFAALPRENARWEALAAAFGPGGRVRAESAATFAALSDPALAQARALVFLGHGLFDRGREVPAGLLLAADAGSSAPEPAGRAVWADDVARAVRAPELVVLLACRSGRAPLRRGLDGGAHLGGAFLRAGARAVVLSCADLEYEASCELARSFAERSSAGDAPAEALRAARCGARPGPQAWNALALRVYGFGHARPSAPPPAAEPARGAPRHSGAWLGAGLAAALFGLFTWRARRRA